MVVLLKWTGKLPFTEKFCRLEYSLKISFRFRRRSLSHDGETGRLICAFFSNPGTHTDRCRSHLVCNSSLCYNSWAKPDGVGARSAGHIMSGFTDMGTPSWRTVEHK